MPILLADPSGRGASVGANFRRGLVVVTILAVVGALVLMQSRGAFQDSVRFTANVNGVGDGLHSGADVKVRGVRIGLVSGVRHERVDGGGNRFEVDLDITPRYADSIASSARARVVPSNIFGAPSIQLVVDERDSRPLPRGATIPADTSREGVLLQSVYSTMRDLLNAVEPSKLNAVLTALAESFRGRGDQVGRMIDELDSYVTALNRNTGEFTDSLDSLSTALRGLQENAPELLDTVDSFLVTSQTIAEKEQQIARLLGGTRTTVGAMDQMVREYEDPLLRLLDQGTQITAAVASTSGFIPSSFQALRVSLQKIAEVLRNGLKINFAFVSNPFDPYTAEDCPRYPGLNGPNCGGGR